MKHTRIMRSFAVATLVLIVGHSLAQKSEENSESEASPSPTILVNIEELRDSSRRIFELIDSNQSGSISLDEITHWSSEDDQERMNAVERDKALRRQQAISNKFMRRDRETEEFEIVDANSNGFVSEKEFDGREDSIRNHGLELGFQELDIDDNGGVELVEFNAYIDEIEQVDKDKDGSISTIEAVDLVFIENRTEYSEDRSLLKEVFSVYRPSRGVQQSLLEEFNGSFKKTKNDAEDQ
ncbi:MAG: hypothetical protein F4X56_02485 [Gammaproteobacteria bacterium]|nr:hypothetical protein [Gammaproteobacteria bacterium]MYC24768.1 hypothetical protein [Gammaproteobacteria bacterium]